MGRAIGDVAKSDRAQRLPPTAGRDVPVQQHDDVDHRVVHGSIREALERFTTYVESVPRLLGASESRSDS